MSQPKDPAPEPKKMPPKPRPWGTAPHPRADLPKPSRWGRQAESRKAPVNTKGWGKAPAARHDAPSSDSKWGAQSHSPQTGSRFFKWGLFVTFCAAGILGWAGWAKLAPAIEQRYLIEKARECFARQDQNGLQVLLAKVLAINPNNVDACRLAAETLTVRGDFQVIQWRSRVAQLAPENLDDQLALAEALLHFDKVADANKILESIREQASSRFAYQNLAGIAAERLGRGDLAEFHFVKAAALNPRDPVVALRLAVVRLQSPQPSLREEARGALEKLSAEPESKIVALRGLVLDALHENRAGRALPLAEKLQASPGSAFADRLLYLKILQMTGSPHFGSCLAETQQRAAKQPKELAELLGWMNSNDLALFAVHWMHNLPLDFELPGPVQFRNAESYARIGDWSALSALIANADWGNLEFLRNAFLARCFETSGDFINARSRWEAAVAAVPGGGEETKILISIAEQWGWKNDVTTGLWELAKESGDPTRALTRLYKFYLGERDTQGLYRVLSKIVESRPDDYPARNNLSMVSLLLNKDKIRALDSSRGLYSKMPENPAYASTYAFALYCDGKAPEGLEVLNKLTPQQRQEPSAAAYYSLLLAANGRFSEAQSSLKLAKNARLLPEEEQLLRDLVGEN